MLGLWSGALPTVAGPCCVGAAEFWSFFERSVAVFDEVVFGDFWVGVEPARALLVDGRSWHGLNDRCCGCWLLFFNWVGVCWLNRWCLGCWLFGAWSGALPAIRCVDVGTAECWCFLERLATVFDEEGFCELRGAIARAGAIFASDRVDRSRLDNRSWGCLNGASYNRFDRRCGGRGGGCLLYTSPSPRDATLSRMPSSA